MPNETRISLGMGPSFPALRLLGGMRRIARLARSPGAKPRGYRPALAKPALKRPMTSGTTWKVCQ